LQPMVPVSFGVLSKSGYMSLLLPTSPGKVEPTKAVMPNLPPELVRMEAATRLFTSRLHWELSTTITSNHLLAMVAMSNTLMSMNMATFVPDQEKVLMMQKSTTKASWTTEEEKEKHYSQQQVKIKQGWSLLSTHHCFLLPDKLAELDASLFKRPQVEMMARRWQHHCVEIREASQQLLLGELGRMGEKGRKQLVESWAQYLPLYTHTEPIVQTPQTALPPNAQTKSTAEANNEEEFEEEEEEEIVRKPSSLSELKRKQSTAVVLLGVIGELKF
jgi:WD repeat-containing protein 7